MLIARESVRIAPFKLVLCLIIAVASLSNTAPGQYIGVTCGFDYSSDLKGPNTGTRNTPLFNSISSNPNATWDEWADELGASGVDFVCPNLRGSYPNTSCNPTNIAPLLTALKNRGLSNRIKLAIFDDNASSWTAQWNAANGRGFGYAQPINMADTNNWKYLWDYNYKKFYETVPDTNLFKIKGRPLIIIWSGNTYFLGNMQGNVSKSLLYVRQQCSNTFGFNPYIILSGDFLSNDTTCNSTKVTDAIQNWFTPNSTHSNGFTLATFNGVKIGALCPQFQNPTTLPATWLDPAHGVSFANDLTRTRGAGALVTLVEGFTDWEEDAAVFRVRNLDSSGNALAYTNTYYDYPNQRLNILRQYGNNPFPMEMKFEAESCDTYGGANGGNGKANYFRNGNIAVETTTDAGGGYNVGWIQPGAWLEWRDVPIQGSRVHLKVRVASPATGKKLHFVIDGIAYPPITLPNTGGYQTWATVDNGVYSFPKGTRHTVRIVCETDGFNLNYWQFQNEIPIGATISLLSKANNRWVSMNNDMLSATAQTPGINESFVVADASSYFGYGNIALQAQTTGKYLTADTNGVVTLTANATSIDRPQTFQWTDNGDGTISLRAQANSMAVSAINAAGSPVIAKSINPGVRETFAIIRMDRLPSITEARVSGSSFLLRGTNGLPGGSYSVVSSPDLQFPPSNWAVGGTGVFDLNGEFSNTIPMDASTSVQILQIRQP